MFAKKLVATIVVAAASTGFGAPAFAQEGTQDDFMILFKMHMMDKNKDGMVSKQEFLNTMAQVWDMKAKKMNVKGDRMTLENFNEVLMYLKAGG
jgi:hypothetical protein